MMCVFILRDDWQCRKKVRWRRSEAWCCDLRTPIEVYYARLKRGEASVLLADGEVGEWVEW